MKFEMIANAAFRRLESLFPGVFGSAKHNHYADFGWPTEVSFAMLHGMFNRNALAHAVVERTVMATWQTSPAIWESEKPAESQAESDIRQRFDDLSFWRACAEADRRSIVGGYSGLILRYADNRSFADPVETVPGGIDGLAGVIPAWAGQLDVSRWDSNPASETYGQPLEFVFHESGVSSPNHQQPRHLTIHPDRVVIWSADGTVHARSPLEPAYNAMIDAEKISGASGESFWKVSRSAPALIMDKDASSADMARAMGVEQEKLGEAISEMIDAYAKGFDKALLLQGMDAKTLAATLPSPEHFFALTVQQIAAALLIPQKILVGNQNGDRASVEDQRDWRAVNMARREGIARPIIRDIIARFEKARILPERDWVVDWPDTDLSTETEKAALAMQYSDVNARAMADPTRVEPPITDDEIRAAAGLPPRSEIEG